MKKITSVLILLILVPNFLKAQEVQTKSRELGINFTGLNSFGIRYKSGNERTLLRLTILSLSDSKSVSKPDANAVNQSSFNFGLAIGFEKTKAIDDKLGFYSGMDLLFNYYSDSYVENNYNYKRKAWTMLPGLGLVLGLSYKISEKTALSVEVVPSVRYSYGKSDNTSNGVEIKQTNRGFNFGLSNLGANLTLSYKFGKKKA
jgi:hypothetical protein